VRKFVCQLCAVSRDFLAGAVAGADCSEGSEGSEWGRASLALLEASPALRRLLEWEGCGVLKVLVVVAVVVEVVWCLNWWNR